MATLKTISAALKLVDAKKENLRKAFEELQSHSSSLSSFNLTWSDLDSYFSSLHSSLQHKFKILQSQSQSQSQTPNQPDSHPPSNPPSIQPSSSPVVVKESSYSPRVQARAELKSLCEKMDGLGLRNYMVERPKERNEIRAELADALRHAPDAAALVLGAMEGFYVSNSRGDKDIELCAMRRSCVVLLEELRRLKKGEIGGEVREKAKELAAEWKGKVSSVDGENPLEALAFFHLLATYGLAAEGFGLEKLMDFAVEVARFRETVELFRLLGFGDKMSDVILKLIGKSKQLVAVKLIFEFELSDKFPPVPILEEYVKESKRLAKKALKGKNNSIKSQKEAATKEVNSLKAVIKIIDDYKLESQYPKEKIVKRLETLEKWKSDRKNSGAAPASKFQKQSMPRKLSGSKRPRTTPPARPAAIPISVAATSSTVPALQQSHLQPAGLLPEHLPPYLGSPAGPYGLAGSTPAKAPYAGSSSGLYGSTGAPFGDPGNLMPSQPTAPYAVSSSGLYGSTGAPFGDPGNLMPSQPHVYPSESHMATGYYDRPVAYGGYGMVPQYHQPYYPQ